MQLRRLPIELIKSLPPERRAQVLRALGDCASMLRLSRGGRLDPITEGTYHESGLAAVEVYRSFGACQLGSTAAEMIKAAVRFGYLEWPRKIRHEIPGQDILDIGCGPGLHGIGYLVAGARSYTGVDPMAALDRDFVKNTRLARRAHFGWTPAQVMDEFPKVRIVSATFEALETDSRYDIAVLHNVTEHLHKIGAVIDKAADKLRPSGRLLFNHHNFYCWNGHHMRPKAIDELDPNDSEQLNYVDWAHLSFEAPPEHYISRGLNKIRLDELRALVERHFDVETWEEAACTPQVGGGRLTDEIAARFPGLSRRDLLVHNVYCTAQRRTTT